MTKPAFDADALISMFENASARGSAQLRGAVEQATLTALQGRELTVKNIRGALDAVTKAVSQGAANNTAGIDAAALLDRAVQGMDDALLKAVQANRTALQQFVPSRSGSPGPPQPPGAPASPVTPVSTLPGAWVAHVAGRVRREIQATTSCSAAGVMPCPPWPQWALVSAPPSPCR